MTIYIIGFFVLLALGVLIFFVPDAEADDFDLAELHDADFGRVGTDSMTSEKRMGPHDNVRPIAGDEYTRHGVGVRHD